MPDTVVIPFNDPDAAVARLEEVGDQLAAVLVEPVMGSAGMVAAEPAYLEALREVTGRVGALLVIDEVITLRLATGGAQEHFGIEPDLSCFGKMLGGGFPLGAFGGSAEVMAHFDPERPDALAQPGSMNAYPVALAASMATLRDLTPERIVALNEGGGRLRDGLREVAAHHGAPVAVTGLGSLLALHTTDRPVRNFRDTWSEDRDLGHRIFLGLLNEGVLIDRRGAACLSTATTDAHVARFVDALDAVLARNC